jgi:hypothetical protein
MGKRLHRQLTPTSASAYFIHAARHTHVIHNLRNKKTHLVKVGLDVDFLGVADGARTHDNRNHNPDFFVFPFVE